MKKTRILLLGVCLFALSAFAFQSPADQGGQEKRGGQRGPGRQTVEERLQAMTEFLGLTPAQQSQIKPILEDTQQQMQAIMKDDSLSREDRGSKMRSLREATDEKIRAVLNDEQKKKFDERRKEQQGPRRGNEKGGEAAPKQ
jgi:Spy/CpxP family protein refolding chaperone